MDWSWWRYSLVAMCMLVMGFSGRAFAEQFSVRCARDGWYFLTFDTDAKRAVWESPSKRNSGTAMKGNITSIVDAEIQFELLRMGAPPVKATLNRTSGQLIPIVELGATNWIWQCENTQLRPVLGRYDSIAPYD